MCGRLLRGPPAVVSGRNEKSPTRVDCVGLRCGAIVGGYIASRIGSRLSGPCSSQAAALTSCVPWLLVKSRLQTSKRMIPSSRSAGSINTSRLMVGMYTQSRVTLGCRPSLMMILSSMFSPVLRGSPAGLIVMGSASGLQALARCIGFYSGRRSRSFGRGVVLRSKARIYLRGSLLRIGQRIPAGL